MKRIQAGDYTHCREETFCFGATPRGRRIVVVVRTWMDGRKEAAFGFGGYDVANFYPCKECTDGAIPSDCPERNVELKVILDLLCRSGAPREENYKILLGLLG